eukprot:c40450_g1_i1 orf=35-262(-)
MCILEDALNRFKDETIDKLFLELEEQRNRLLQERIPMGKSRDKLSGLLLRKCTIPVQHTGRPTPHGVVLGPVYLL